MACGLWGVRFGGWGLGFGVWGLGFGFGFDPWGSDRAAVMEGDKSSNGGREERVMRFSYEV